MEEFVTDGNQTVPSQAPEEKKIPREKKETVTKAHVTLRQLTIIGLLGGITLALGFGGYGIVAIGPLNVTSLHVPALIGALVEGPKVGAFVGLIFGLYSFWQNFTAPNILSPLFLNPIISVVPRVIFPVLAYLIYKALWKAPQGPRLIVGSVVGTILHTIMVMGLIYVFYANMFADKMKLAADQVLGTIVFLSVTHGVPEAIFAGVIVTPVALALRKALRKDVPKKN